MSADDPRDSTDPTDGTDSDESGDIEPADLRTELDRQRGRTRPETDGEELIDLLSAAFDTDKRTRIYVALRREPDSTVEELAESTGLYPTAVERVLSDLHDEGVIERRAAAGDGEAEYTAIAPQEAIDVVLGRVQDEIDSRFGLDRSRERAPHDRSTESVTTTEPVTIPVKKDGEDTETTSTASTDTDPNDDFDE